MSVVARQALVAPAERIRVQIQGAVQGVGFRPFVYRLAQELALDGFVCNSAQGVVVEVEGPRDVLETFLARLQAEAPPAAWIESLQVSRLAAAGTRGFHIQTSRDQGPKSALILPDLATCPRCLAEVLDPQDRRYRYPFTNCTDCGPRYSIIRRLPYDRPHTTMAGFTMCPACRAEYETPGDRRFHAQPNACPVCGPHLALWGADGQVLAQEAAALEAAVRAIRAGQIVAVKGLGGFHLLVDAGQGPAVAELRRRKRRGDKPFAVMFPNLDQIRACCLLSPEEAALLDGPTAPIVLLPRRQDAPPWVHPQVAPGVHTIGAFLPYTPLHHLLLRELGRPVVATSGNRSDEPICIREDEALDRLHGIADCFLVHNRPIQRPVDDSVLHVVAGGLQLLRRSRGYAPLPLHLPRPAPGPVLALGGHQKNTVALALDRRVILSQHIGDLASAQGWDLFHQVVRDLLSLYEASPALLACDLHPDYHTTHCAEQWAEAWGVPLVRVQHHYAHALACMAEHGLDPPVLAVVWDGTGYGPDGTVWGGEFLQITQNGYVRRGHLRPFRLPGGEQAVREPRRVALSLLHSLDSAAPWVAQVVESAWTLFEPAARPVLAQMLARGLHAPLTTSAGRLFDGVACLLGLPGVSTYEGQAAVMLETLATAAPESDAPPLPYAVIRDEHRDAWTVDWAPTLAGLLADQARGESPARLARRFHRSLAQAIREVAVAVGIETVVLSGGCFQNRLLTEMTLAALEAAGLRAFIHRRVPPNDGGLALGQVMAALVGGIL